MMRKIATIAAFAGAAAKGARKFAATAATAAKHAETAYKVLLTGVVIYDMVVPKRKRHTRKGNKRALLPAKK